MGEAALVAMLVFGAATPARAYLDPGSGSMLLQLVLGGFAGVAVAIRLYWRRLRGRFQPSDRGGEPPDRSARAGAD